jgi:Contractile injection system tape measure protein
MVFVKNIIRKQTVHFKYNGDEDGFALQKEVNDWCTRTLLPQLEQQLAPYCSVEQYLSLDKLEIDAVIESSDWQQKLQQQILTGINKQLEQYRSVAGKPQAATEILWQHSKVVTQAPGDMPGNMDETNSNGVQKSDNSKKTVDQVTTASSNKKSIAAKNSNAKLGKAVGEIAEHNVDEVRKDAEKKTGRHPDEYISAGGKKQKEIAATGYAAQDKLDAASKKNVAGKAIAEKENPAFDKKSVAANVAQPQNDSAIAPKTDELFVFFFKYGYLPWWHQAVVTGDFEVIIKNWVSENKTAARAEFISKQLQQAFAAPVIARMLQYMPGQVFFQFTKNVFKKEADLLEQIASFFAQQVFKNITAAKQQQLVAPAYAFMLNGLLSNNLSGNTTSLLQVVYAELQKQQLTAILTPALPKKRGDKASPVEVLWQQLLVQQQAAAAELIAGKPVKQNPIAKANQITQAKAIAIQKEQAEKLMGSIAKDLQEGIFIENAGVVIAAAFLSTLFTNLKLAKNGSLLKAGAAAMLVQHIVTGSTKVTEFELVLPKILCGINLEAAVNTSKRITKLQKKEVEQMLLSIIEHWAVLQNTSVQGLRETFLQRNGKLTFSNNEWMLQVEQKPFDMLLQQLPWNISMIKLPWMQHLLRTEWA